jgi:hypothetical protein
MTIMMGLAVAITAIAATILGLVYRVALDIRTVQDVLMDIRLVLMAGNREEPEGQPWPIGYGHPHSASLSVGFFTIWQWETSADGKKRWVLKSTLVPPGVDPGLPPDQEGRYEGQCEKKWVPASRL